ncbi:MAG: hypothetical protein A3B38_03845 [Candidatus Levybacteria bacterium RIFCSPLOWO2_01_FULL_36_13]|nr:MAG: hypothetical protein A2684_00780 [Candidatus Levybacteria bacterium RIFCSPHIGHO2_01_FULL_36_15b]OGH34264.1 MAG: hypothetical protein A3B38_03845 [Candidatus Levybacteria bacterium RIFCSPLOWO2_01_FULL_36_13]
MSKNPLLNASTALLYIILIASVMYYGSGMVGQVKSVIGPIAILSLFTLSAAVMGYVFVFQPLRLYLDGKKKESVNLFSKTLAIFAVMTLVIFIVFFSGIYKMFL